VDAPDYGPPSILVEPSIAPPGTKTVVYGSGFVPDEQVRVLFKHSSPYGDVNLSWGPGGAGGLVTVNQYGAFELKASGGVPVAANIDLGVYTVKAIGDKGSVATAPFVVEAAK
jgi:hypothetical protein